MTKGSKETITIRAISVGFVVLALAIFKPFGLDMHQGEAYAHLLAIGILGYGGCMLTEAILKYIVRKPRSFNQGIGYIIRRNLWFQFINTPLVTFIICLYRHFVLSDQIDGNQLSWGNFFETLLIIAFCSFAIGLYWRFKFRSLYLQAELEETRQLNDLLQKTQAVAKTEPTPTEITLNGTTHESVKLSISELLYIESVGNYLKIFQLKEGNVQSDMIRTTLKQMEDDLHDFSMIVRCHRAYLVNLQQVDQIVSKSGIMQLTIKHCQDTIPVSRSNMAQVKEAIKQYL